MAITVGTDSFISLADAEDYFDTRLNIGDWDDQTDPIKEKALKHASRMINDLFVWPGEISDDSQILGWPRAYVYDCEGRELDSSLIPPEIERATCEQALYLLGAVDPNQYPDLIKQGFKKAKLDVMEVETDKSMIPDMIAPAVQSIIGCLGTMKPSGKSSGAFFGSTIRA